MRVKKNLLGVVSLSALLGACSGVYNEISREPGRVTLEEKIWGGIRRSKMDFYLCNTAVVDEAGTKAYGQKDVFIEGEPMIFFLRASVAKGTGNNFRLELLKNGEIDLNRMYFSKDSLTTLGYPLSRPPNFLKPANYRVNCYAEGSFLAGLDFQVIPDPKKQEEK